MQTDVRHSRTNDFLAGAHEVMLCGLRHRLIGVLIGAMGAAGLVGTLVTFWPY